MGELQGVFHGMDIIGSALTAELQRSEIVSANLSHMNSTRGGPDGGPYRRRSVVFEEAMGRARGLAGELPGADGRASGVKVARVYEDRATPLQERYDPSHPDADERGIVESSNVELFKEMVDMMIIERSFQSNLAAMRSYKQMLTQTIQNMNR